MTCSYCKTFMNVHKKKDKDGHITYICKKCGRMSTERKL